MAPRTSKVTPVQVRKAVIWLQDSGKKPTVEAVRDWLGGGSTKILAEILKRQKNIEGEALIIARQISPSDLFNVITREQPDAMNYNLQEITEASLACFFGEHNDATDMTVREYVEAAFDELSTIDINVEYKINEMYEDAFEEEQDKDEINKELWLRAYSHAARHADEKELTLLFVEDWLKSQ